MSGDICPGCQELTHRILRHLTSSGGPLYDSGVINGMAGYLMV